MSGSVTGDSPAQVAGRAAAVRADELATRSRALDPDGPGRVFDETAAAGNLQRAQERAERSLERSADAHDAAARLHDGVAARFDSWAMSHPTADGYELKAQFHRESAAADRQLAEADRLILIERRATPKTGADGTADPNND